MRNMFLSSGNTQATTSSDGTRVTFFHSSHSPVKTDLLECHSSKDETRVFFFSSESFESHVIRVIKNMTRVGVKTKLLE